MRASEKYQILIKSPIAMISYYFTEIILTNDKEKFGKYIQSIHTGKTPSKKVAKYWSSEDYIWYKPEDIGFDKYLGETSNKISNSAVSERKATIYKINTLLITGIGDIGRIGITTKEASSNQQITGLTFNSKILVDYAYHYLLPRKDYMQDDSSSTTLPILNQSKIKNLLVKVPIIELQKEFLRYLEYCEDCYKNNVFPEDIKFNLDEKLFIFANKIFNLCYLEKSTEITFKRAKILKNSFLNEFFQSSS